MASVDVSYKDILLQLTTVSSRDVVVTLLHCAPACDRAAAAMWRLMASRRKTAENVVNELLHVMADWPMHSTRTSDGDNRDVFPLAATRALCEILYLRKWPGVLAMHFPQLFIALMYQVSASTEQMPAEVVTFWRRCRQEGCLPTQANRFAMQTMKELLCRIHFENLVLKMECKHGWEALLNAHTFPTAVGLLAREMIQTSGGLAHRTADFLIKSFKKKQCWELPAMAFLVEILDCPNLKDMHRHVMLFIQRCLQSDSIVMRRLLLRSLVKLCRKPWVLKRAENLGYLLPSLIPLLQVSRKEVLSMTLYVISKAIQGPICSSTALSLAENVLPLFNYDDLRVQLLSLHIFHDVMEFVEEEGENPLEDTVHQSLIPLLFLLHHEDEDVAEVSWLILCGATKFLNVRGREQMLQRDNMRRFIKHLFEEYPSRADEYLQQAMLHLQSPQEHIREAAIKFLGIAAKKLMRQPEKVRNICNTLQDMAGDASLSISSLAAETLRQLRHAKRRHRFLSRLQVLPDFFYRTWRRLRSPRTPAG